MFQQVKHLDWSMTPPLQGTGRAVVDPLASLWAWLKDHHSPTGLFWDHILASSVIQHERFVQGTTIQILSLSPYSALNFDTRGKRIGVHPTQILSSSESPGHAGGDFEGWHSPRMVKRWFQGCIAEYRRKTVPLQNDFLAAAYQMHQESK